MIKKKIFYKDNFEFMFFMSLLKYNKKFKNLKIKKLNIIKKKNFFIKKVVKLKKLKKYKKYKLLNLKILKKKKFFFINFYNKFFDILSWLLFFFSKDKLKKFFKINFWSYKKRIKKFKKKKKLLKAKYLHKVKNRYRYKGNDKLLKVSFENIVKNASNKKIVNLNNFNKLAVNFLSWYQNSKIIKLRRVKKNLNFLKQNRDKRNYFIFCIFNYLYYIGLFQFEDMFSKGLNNTNYTVKNIGKLNLIKKFITIWDIYKFKLKKNKKNFLLNIQKNLKLLRKDVPEKQLFILRNFLKKSFFIKKKLKFKFLNYYKNFFFKNKRLTKKEKFFIKKEIFIKNINLTKQKKRRQNISVKKNFFLIKKRIKYYFKKFFKRNVIKFKYKASFIKRKERLFYYDFVFNMFEKNTNLMYKQNKIVFILWNNIVNKTFLRFRLSEYIFNKLSLFNDKFSIQKKIYFILNFYKIIVLLKKNLKNFKRLIVKKYLLKKYLLKKNLKKKVFKYYFKKEYFIQHFLYKNFGKLLLKYFVMLKYFNKIFFFLLKNLKFNITTFISNNSSYMYLSLLLNLGIKGNNLHLPLVNVNDYFMQKTNKAFVNAWLINDNIFKYVSIYDKALKKDLYWNNLSTINILAKRDIEKSFLMIPNFRKGVNLNYSYFFGKNKLNRISIKNVYNIYVFFYMYVIFFFLKYLNYALNKNYLVNNIEDVILRSYSKLRLRLKMFLIKINTINLTFSKKFFILHNFLLLKNRLKIQKLNLYFKKLYLYKLIVWLLYLIFKFNYNNIFLKFNRINKGKQFFTNFYKSNYCFIENVLYDVNFIKKLYKWKKNKYIFNNFFLNIKKSYYAMYSEYNMCNFRKCILHLIERRTNNFLVLSLFKTKRVIGHTSAGQALYRPYYNNRRQKKGTGVLSKILYRKLRLRARKYALKEVFLKSNLYWNFRVNFLTKYWVLRYKLGVPYLKGVKVGLGLPYHKGLRVYKRKRK